MLLAGSTTMLPRARAIGGASPNVLRAGLSRSRLRLRQSRVPRGRGTKLVLAFGAWDGVLVCTLCGFMYQLVTNAENRIMEYLRAFEARVAASFAEVKGEQVKVDSRASKSRTAITVIASHLKSPFWSFGGLGSLDLDLSD